MKLCNFILSFLVIWGTVASTTLYGADSSKISRAVAQEAKVIIEDTVHRLRTHPSGQKIMFRVHAGVYYLKNDSKYYDSILSTLKSSRDKGEMIKVKADATTLEIEELIINTK